MLKFLQKNMVVPALVATALTVNAQDATENFQSWTGDGYSSASFPITDPAVCYTGAKPTGVDIGPITKTYSSSTIIYNLHNGGVNPDCGPRGPKDPTTDLTPLVGSKGYVEFGKYNENADLKPGSLTTSEFPHLETIDVIISFTGNNRKMLLQKSTDKGASWVNVPSPQEDMLLAGIDSLNGGIYGTAITGIEILSDNVMLRFSNSNQRARIHDIAFYYTPTAIEKVSLLDNGAKITTVDNRVTLSSPKSGIVEVVGINGVVAAEGEVQAGNEVSFTIPAKGLYVVRFVSNNQVLVKKIVVQ